MRSPAVGSAALFDPTDLLSARMKVSLPNVKMISHARQTMVALTIFPVRWAVDPERLAAWALWGS
jgi:hypothetical protein